MTRTTAVLMALTLSTMLGGCEPRIKQEIDAANGRRPRPSQCDAAAAQSLIGRQQSDRLGIEARDRSGARTLRWLWPGGVATLDYRPDRLNVRVDAQNRVVEIRCG